MKWIYVWKDGKRLVIDAENQLQADDKAKEFAKSKGYDPSIVYEAKKTQEGTAKKVAEEENRALAGKIKAERQAVQAEEDEVTDVGSFLKRAGKSLLRMTNPYTAEAYESGQEPSMATSAGDVVNAFGLASIPKAIAGKLAPKSMMALSGTEWANDIAQQQSIQGKVDPMRTTLGGVLSFAPEIGAKAKQGLQNTAEKVIHNVVLPSQASQQVKPLNYRKMLEERIFSGLGKYSGIEKMKAKMQPYFDIMQNAREGGATVDLSKAYRQVVSDIKSDKSIPEEFRGKILSNVDNIFQAEIKKAETLVPAVTEMVPSKAHEYTMKELESIAKGKLTKARKQYNIQIENMRNSGMSEEQIAKITGNAPIDPIKDVGLKQIKEPSIEDFYSFEDAKRQADEMFDPFDERVVQKEYLSYDIPLGDAMSLKSGMQDIGFRTTSEAPYAEAYRASSRGLLDGIDQSDPVVRNAMRDIADYMAMTKQMERRKGVGGSHSVVSLKDLMALNAGGFPGLLLNKLPSTTFGGQLLYDAGRGTPTLGNILGLTRPQLSEMIDEQNP